MFPPIGLFLSPPYYADVVTELPGAISLALSQAWSSLSKNTSLSQLSTAP